MHILVRNNFRYSAQNDADMVAALEGKYLGDGMFCLRKHDFVKFGLKEFAEEDQTPSKELYFKIKRQIEYYFGNRNYYKDQFLLKNKDEEGSIPIKILLTFNKMKMLTDSVDLVMECL